MNDLQPVELQRNLYQAPFKLPPLEATKQFQWADYLLNADRNFPVINAFCDRNQETLHLNADNIMSSLQKAFKIGEEIVAQRPDDPQLALTYHDQTHTKITAVVGLGIFLGKLQKIATDEKFKTYFQRDPTLAGKLVNAHILISVLHEVDDWWNIGCSEAQLNRMKNIVSQSLPDYQLGIGDFNRLIILDDFLKPLDEIITNQVLSNKIEKPFFPADGPTPLLDTFQDETFKREMLQAFGSATRAADFMQILNPAYRQTVIFPNSNHQTKMGPVALAEEMSRLRPNALNNMGWASEQVNNSVLWEKVTMSRYFIEKIAAPNIESGIHDLKEFNEVEYANALKIWEEIQAQAKEK